MNKLNELLKNVNTMMDIFAQARRRTLEDPTSILDYIETLPESTSKKIVIDAFSMYERTDNTINPIAEVLIPELAKYIEDTLVQCVLGEIWCGERWIKKSNYFREKAALNGNSYSMVALGKDYLAKGENTEGKVWLRRAIINGYDEARLILAEHYIEKDYNLDEAKELLMLVVDSKNRAKFKRKLGEIFHIEGNKEEMITCYISAAHDGDVFAQCYLGYYYTCTYHGEENLDEALKWFKEAANNQSKIVLELDNETLTRIYSSLTDYSNILPSDFGCPCQIKEVLKVPYIDPRALAKFYVAEQYRKNANYAEAINYFKEIKDEIDYSAKRLATIYELLNDFEQALYWSNFAYETSELRLSCWGASNSGRIYFEFFNDPDTGIKWYKRSATKGDFDATMFLGDYYASNEQYDEAIYWYMKFARGLHPNDLSYCCGNSYDYEKEQSGTANKKLSKLLEKLGLKQMAQYYYFNTLEGIKSRDFLAYLEKIGEYEGEQYTALSHLFS